MYFGPLPAYSPLTQPHLDTAKRMPAKKYRKARKAIALFYWTSRRIDGNRTARYIHQHCPVTTGPTAKKRTEELHDSLAEAKRYQQRSPRNW